MRNLFNSQQLDPFSLLIYVTKRNYIPLSANVPKNKQNITYFDLEVLETWKGIY